MKRAVRRSLESMSTIYKILQESFQGIKVIKAFCTERVERRRFFGETKNLYRKSVRVAMIDAMSDPVLEMLTLTTVVIALLAGSYLVLNQTIYLNFGLFRLQLAARADGDPGPVDPVHDACRRRRPNSQAGKRAFQDPTGGRRGRPDLRPDGPAAKGFGEQAIGPVATAPGTDRAGGRDIFVPERCTGSARDRPLGATGRINRPGWPQRHAARRRS